MRPLIIGLCLLLGTSAWAADTSPGRPDTTEAQRLDAAAFDGFERGISETRGDVQSVVVVLQGRTVFEYYRDGDPDALRDIQSVSKSALALLVGTALQRGDVASLEQPVLELMPEWKALNPDARAQAITLRHLLSMTSGFDVNDPAGTAAPLAPSAAWARALGAAPGQRFAYDNSMPGMVSAVLERATGQAVADLARDRLVAPLGLHQPAITRGVVRMRTADMARLGQLMLQGGTWRGEPLMPFGFSAQLVQPQSAGGGPVGLSYGLSWWVASANTYFASGYGGQAIWVHAPMGLVVAITSTVSPSSQQRGQAMALVRGRIFQAAQKRLASTPSEGATGR